MKHPRHYMELEQLHTLYCSHPAVDRTWDNQKKTMNQKNTAAAPFSHNLEPNMSGEVKRQ